MYTQVNSKLGFWLQRWGGGFAKLPSFEFTWVYPDMPK
jgi:hypothetical protein